MFLYGPDNHIQMTDQSSCVLEFRKNIISKESENAYFDCVRKINLTLLKYAWLFSVVDKITLTVHGRVLPSVLWELLWPSSDLKLSYRF